MKLAYYALGSAASAAGVVVYAFNQRANFYSACVYLAQSNLCLMILINLVLFAFGSFMFGLQRLFYGPLRPIEIEQLYEKAWFAVTETCLAMTMFRDEVGAWFLVMFVALLTGKVWGWIGEGRVEILEQQPPANPRLFHIRLSLSLALSLLYDSWVLAYTINTVIQQARPNMMVMFLFEFAVLTTSSWSTALRYSISLIEANIIKKQTAERLEERRREVREEREEILRQRASAAEAGTEGSTSNDDIPNLPSEDDIDEMDLEVPGWEAKGQWILTLDLLTDFVKLGIYSAFFFIILTFYGLPIHIMRDLFLTARSFVKRLTAFLRYRRATHLMNERYQDATAEDLAREDTCIVCREEMRPWIVPIQNQPLAAGQAPAQRPLSSTAINERNRPKKLPCGHILHLGCLKSWLERQQVCPTCRAPVVEQAQQPAPPQNQAPGGQPPQPPVAPQQQGGANPPPPQPGHRPNGGMRMLNLGPLRVGFGQPQDILQQLNNPPPGQPNAAPAPRMYGVEVEYQRRQQQAPPSTSAGSGHPWQTQLSQIEAQIVQEVRNLQVAQNELHVVQALQAELARLRLLNNNVADSTTPRPSHMQTLPTPQFPTFPHQPLQAPSLQRHGALPGSSAIPAGSPDLPPGVVIPEGWSLLPLQRIDNPSWLSSNPASGTVPTNNVNVSQARDQQTLSPPSGPSDTTQVAAPDTRSGTPEPRASTQPHSESIARLEEQRNMIHYLPEETRSLAERLINAETNALRQRASAESLSNSYRATSTGVANDGMSSTRSSDETNNMSQMLPSWGSPNFVVGSRAGPNQSSGQASSPQPTPTQPSTTSPNEREADTTDNESGQVDDKGKGRVATVEDAPDDEPAAE